MGRRSFISMTAINRMISASNARRREKERQELIESQSGGAKELAPTYELLSVDFNFETRATKIEIQQSQQYRTIERYVTQNYVRYPIYSYWKTRTKTIKKTLKLTNQELELLNSHSDSLIRDFASDIILALKNEELFPSWFIKDCLRNEYSQKVNGWENEKQEYHRLIEAKIDGNKRIISNYKADITSNEEILKTKRVKRNRLQSKLQKIDNAKKSAAKSVFSLFIYNYFKSSFRKGKLCNKLSEIETQIKVIEDSNTLLRTEVSNLKRNIQELNDDYSTKKTELEDLKKDEFASFSKNLKEVQPLPCQISGSSGFTPLKIIAGLEYEKIVGCYIIRNKEKDKYYVGQSKDVIKRLKQHFKGTIPNNIIFAEDYYSSSMDKSDLFEVKILPCATKDDLDRTEKQLIEKYDAFNSGYNGTNGNS